MASHPTALQLTAEQYRQLSALLHQHLPDNVEVWAYGSRTKGTAQPWSDLDLVIMGDNSLRIALEQLREAFEESDLPFRVDLFLWDDLPENFRKNIEQHHVPLNLTPQRTGP